MAGIVVSTTFGAAMGWWAWHEARTSRERVQSFVVYIEPNGQMVGDPVALGTEWSPQDGVFLDFGQRWVRNLRARPLDIETLKFQRREVIMATDRRAFTQLEESMRQADKIARSSAIVVDQISANLVEKKGDTALVLVRWQEELQAGGAKPSTWTASMRIVHVEPKARREFEANPLGLFVAEFQITQVKS